MICHNFVPTATQLAVGETVILLHSLYVYQVFQYARRGSVSKMTVSPMAARSG